MAYSLKLLFFSNVRNYNYDKHLINGASLDSILEKRTSNVYVMFTNLIKTWYSSCMHKQQYQASLCFKAWE